MNNSFSTLTILFFHQNFYGITNEVFLSLPSVLDNHGISNVVKMTLKSDEEAKLQQSATTLWDIQKDLKF